MYVLSDAVSVGLLRMSSSTSADSSVSKLPGSIDWAMPMVLMSDSATVPPTMTRLMFRSPHGRGDRVRGSQLLLSNPDRTVDVTADDGTVSTCAGLAADERRVFRLAGCDPPLED